MPAKPVFHRAPLMDIPFSPLPPGAVTPEGWLLEQLKLQAGALRETLSARWPDLADAGAWQSPREADWPLDAALLAATLPLGYLLKDAAWLEASRRRVAWAMEAQREDGCLPPFGDEDGAWCARAALMQVFQQHYMATADKQALVHMLRYSKYAWDQMDERPLGMRASAQAGELLQPVLWLYRATEKRFLLELARALQSQSVDWTAFCHTMPVKTPMEKQFPWAKLRQGMKAEDSDIRQYHIQSYQQAQAVSLASGLKTPSLIAQLTGGIKHAEAFDVGYAKLMRYHGLANGLFSGDDLLNGASPSQGTMCAAVSGLMSTLEALIASSGGASYGDVLEKLAFNALPAAYSNGMRAWQRVQQPNQIDLSAPKRGWYNAKPEASAFVSELADAELSAIHHGLPRFAASLWMASKDGGIAAVSYAPCTVRAGVGGAAVRVEVKTAYPFDGNVTLRIHVREPAAFPLHLRVPSWAEGATMAVGEDAPQDGQPGTYAVLNRTWHPGDVVKLAFPMQVALSNWYHHSAALSRGPLLLALSPDGSSKSGEQTWPEGTPWAYALLPGEGSRVCCDPAQAAPFGEGLPLVVEVKAAPLPEWTARDGSAEAPPIAPAVDAAKAVTLRLVPYGGTKLRVCQFPVA